MYLGAVDEGKKQGKGKLYDARNDEVYEGEFENDKKANEGYLFKRNGDVFKGDFRNNLMEGNFERVCNKLSKSEIDKVFY